MDGFCVETLYLKKIEVPLLGSSLSSSLEIILFAELLYLSGWLDVCRKLLDSTICSPCWRDANTASILTPCWILDRVNKPCVETGCVVLVLNETNTDVCMYTWRIYSGRCSHIAVQVGTEMHGWKSQYFIYKCNNRRERMRLLSDVQLTLMSE